MRAKDRLLVLLHILQECTDDETPITTSKLLSILAADGQEDSKRTLRRNTQSLQNCRNEIVIREKSGGSKEYA